MPLNQYFKNLVEGKRRGPDALLLRPLLIVLSLPYALIMRLRALAYKRGLLPAHRLARPVISVGNITVGGTGKTPMVALLARYCLSRGKRVVMLSRGYGGSLHGETRMVSDGREIFLTSGEAGDEPYMLAKKIPGLMVVIGPDRYKAGLFAQEHLNPDIFILDDGFQHLRLHRDLNILLMDNTRPFGNGRVLPAGLLREPGTAGKRADLIIYTRCGKSEPVEHLPGIPFCKSTHDLAGVVFRVGEEPEPLSLLSDLKGVAFAGIADPPSFFSMLDNAGMNIVRKLNFPDHCTYSEGEISEIKAARKSAGGDYLITTEKDMVKLSSHLRELGRVYAAVLQVKIPDMPNLTDMIEELL
jgi:tetraacyldisaccharide 4'-kinase